MKSKLELEFSKVNLFDPNGSGIAQSLLIKRQEFIHEKEVRLIYVGDDGKCQNDTFQFKIDPSTAFDRVLFDPRMSEDLRESFGRAAKSLGYSAEIKRSTLYDPPNLWTIKNTN